MFVTEANFNVLPYKLPSLSDGSAEEFADFIDSEEEVHLRMVLGDTLYEAFISGLTPEWDATVITVVNQEYAYGDDIWKALTAQTGTAPVEGLAWTLIEENNRWLLLKNGTIYQINGQPKEYRWHGMVKACTALVWSRWVEYNAQQLTVNGLVTPKVENNIPSDPGTLICRAWNDWSVKIGGSCEWPAFDSLLGYLYYSEELYGDSIGDYTSMITYLEQNYTHQETKNTFGL